MIRRWHFILAVIVICSSNIVTGNYNIEPAVNYDTMRQDQNTAYRLSKSFQQSKRGSRPKSVLKKCYYYYTQLECKFIENLASFGIDTYVHYNQNTKKTQINGQPNLFALKMKTKIRRDSFIECSYTKMQETSRLGYDSIGANNSCELKSTACSSAFVPSFANVEVLGTRLGICPSPNLSFIFSYNYLKGIVKKVNAIHKPQQSLATKTKEKQNFGQEFNFMVDYQYRPQLNLLVKSGYFPTAGRHVKSNPTEDVTVIEGSIIVSF